MFIQREILVCHTSVKLDNALSGLWTHLQVY